MLIYGFIMWNMVSYADLWFALHNITSHGDMWIFMRNGVLHVYLWIYIVQCGFICIHLVHIAEYNSIC